MKHLRNKKGAVAMGMAIAVAFLALTWLGWMATTLSLKRKQGMKELTRVRGTLVMESIAARALTELRIRHKELGGSPTAITVLSSVVGSTQNYGSAANPRRFWKGTFQLDLMNEEGAATGAFEAPEANPVAWIETSSCPGLGATPPACYYKVTVKATLCKQLVGGRTKLDKAEPPSPFTDPPYSPACPTDKVSPATHVFYINTASPHFN